MVPESVRRVHASDGTEIAYRVFEGAAPAVVILHGLAGSSREFIPTAHALTGRQVILVDQRGHGLSTRRPTDTSRTVFVSDVVDVITAEHVAPVDIVGQSMGAHTAMLVAATRPDLVRRLVLLECGEDDGSEDTSTALGDFFRSWPVPFEDVDAAARALGDGPLAAAWIDDLEHRPDGLYPRFDADVMAATISHLAAPRWAEWAAVTAPTLLVYADHGMFSEDQKQRFLDHGTNATRVDLTDASHDAHLDAIDQWITALSEFIDTP